MTQDTAIAEAARPEAEPAPERAASGGQPLLCEVAWEVCQQLGGIYTVIRSKAPTTVARWGRRYVLVGPYNPNTTPAEFEETPPKGLAGRAALALLAQGLEAHYGTWLTPGRPRTVLLNPRCVTPRLGEIKRAFWDHHRIGLPGDDGFVNDVISFGYLVEQFFRALVGADARGRPIIGHFHEWMGGSAIPEIRRAGLPVAVVFTTHATQLGRAMAGNDPGFYDHLPNIDWLGAARQYAMEPKVLLERAAAHGAHVFTTLSEITALECQHLLGRRPDLLLPNGINIERFAAMHEFQNLHLEFKEKIHQFVMAHFFPSYTFDLDRTLYFFSAGRYEYRNKGFDLVLESLARLNGRMKQAGLDRTVVFFLITQRPVRSINAEVLRSRALMEELRHNCEAIKNELGDRLFLATARGEAPKYGTLVDDYWRLRLRRLMHAWKSPRLPLLVTHDLMDEARDDVLRQVHARMMFNLADDPVKVVYHPDFITSTNPLFGIDYDQFVRGCHLGIFPSFYEPWGYTPLECVVSGVPAITSDLAGFGTYLLEHVPDWRERGLGVIRRRGASFDAAANQLTDALFNFLKMERRERIAQRNQVETLSDHFDWQNLGRYYADAHKTALARAGW
jgi:glycogen(starch) synthase